MRQATPAAVALVLAPLLAGLGLAWAQPDIARGDRKSGAEFMSAETQAMQRDDTANPGMLSALDGEALWSQKAGAAGKACADCHQDASATMKGVSARYPAFDVGAGRVVDLQTRVNMCRTEQQQAKPLAFESRELLALTAFIGLQSRGTPISPPAQPQVAAAQARGKALWEQRMGQLDFSCAQCHDQNWGHKLGSAPIPQAHAAGYPIYRLEWQGMGSIQRRFRNCMSGVRAEAYPFGAPEFVDLEAYLALRAEGMPVETPGVRP